MSLLDRVRGGSECAPWVVAEIEKLESELSATKEKLEAADNSIRESQEQKPVGKVSYIDMRGGHHAYCMHSLGELPMCANLYAMPPIQPKLAELQREVYEIAKALHYPTCWDTAAYPTLLSAIHEIADCSVCADPEAHGVVKD